MQGGYEVASMPLKRQRSSVATSIMAAPPSNMMQIENLDSVIAGEAENEVLNEEVADEHELVSQATKSTVIKDQIISKLHEQNLLLKERLSNEESQS